MNFIKKHITLLLTLIGLLFLICFSLLLIPETHLPSTHQSSGLVAIISAFLGVIMTVAVTTILLDKQSETEAQKDKDVKIYEQKIHAYSKFNSEIWKMFQRTGNDNLDRIKEHKLLKSMCMEELVFFLPKKTINELSEVFEDISDNLGNSKVIINNLCKITDILKRNLDYDTATDSVDNEEYLK